jgi:hypothetical protein
MTPEEQAKLQFQNDVKEWQALVAWIAEAKKREKALRESLANRGFHSIKLPNGCIPEGTQRLTVAGIDTNFELTAKSKLNYTILEELMIPTLAEANLTPDESKGLIRGKPELGLRAYKALPEEKRKIVDKMLVIKPGALELDILQIPL